MQRKILTILFLTLVASPAFAQTRTKYTPKLPNFFEGSKPRGELISVGQIVATKVDNNSQATDSFAVTTSEGKPLMGNPLGILPKKNPIIVAKPPEAPKVEQPKDATTAELEEAVSEARSMSEEIRKNMGGEEVDPTNPKSIDKFVNASEKASQRGQLKTPEKKQAEQDYKF